VPAKTTNPIPPPSSGSHANGHHAPDLRPHVAALLELSALGWRVTEIRPDRTAPVLWRVTIERSDRCASISAMELDPDDALDELLRYACADHEDVVGAEAAANVPANSPELPATPNERTPGEP
jgi:hypothetical protein